MNFQLKNKISIKYIPIIILITSGFTFLVTYLFIQHKSEATESIEKTTSNCSYNITRLGGYNFVRPLMFVDEQCEDTNMQSIKEKISLLIENYKNSGALNSAAIYLKDYYSNGWIAINENENYLPGSLLKVPQLITFFKMNELKPGVLNKEISFNHVYNVDKDPKFLSKSIQIGKKYTIRELLTYMIKYSDNNATYLLMENIDQNVFKKVFVDLGLKSPDMSATDYPINVKEYSYFMRTLYNASYLSIEDSEFATELLGECNFKEGIIESLPKNIKIAHKFGEAGNPTEKQLHESAIIYLNDKPYLVTIMTKGKDLNKLPAVIRGISSMVYQEMLNLRN